MHTRSNPLWLLLVLASLSVQAQQTPPLSAEELKEMQQGMQDAQQILNNLDPAAKAQLEQMMQAVPKTPAASVHSTPADKSSSLAAINTNPMTGNELKTYLTKLSSSIPAALAAPSRQRLQTLQALLTNTSQRRAAAQTLATIGAWEEATALQAEVALASGGAQDISNLAAFLVMQQAEPAALPLLHTLNARYPNNSTILNNLGQAYYQAGDTKQAKTFLLAALHRSPTHPQANMTRSIQQLAEGDEAGAQQSARVALRNGYSNSKTEQLRRSGGKPDAQDVRWPRPRSQHSFRLDAATPTLYPEDVEALPELFAKTKQLRDERAKQRQQLAQRASAIPPPTMADLQQISRMPFSAQAELLGQGETELLKRQLDDGEQQLAAVLRQVGASAQQLSEQIAAIDRTGEKKYQSIPGGYQFNYSCKEVKAAISGFLSAHLHAYRAAELKLSDLQIQQARQQINIAQYRMTDHELQRTQLMLQAGLIRDPDGARGLSDAVSGVVEQRQLACWPKTEAKNTDEKPFRLSDYEDTHCEEAGRFGLPGFALMTIHCNKVTYEFEPALMPVSASWTSRDTGRGGETALVQATAAISIDGVTVSGHSEFAEDGWSSGGISVSGGTGVSEGRGPLEIGVGVEVSGTVEFDRSGVTDIRVDAEGSIKASGTAVKTDAVEAGKASLETSTSSSWSWNAGYSGDSGSSLSGAVL